MSTVHQSTFVIARDDRDEDPKTIVSDGLRIGRLSDSDVWLNHPAVSRLHAGINKIGGYFYLTNLSASSATTLNGRVIPFNEAEALTDGDELQIGPYFLRVEHAAEALKVTVVLQIAHSVGERVGRHTSELYKKQLTLKQDTGKLIARSSEVANSLKVFWDKRTREKAGRPSPLHPRTPPRVGKIRFNWIPTRDLVRPWPFGIFLWALIVVGTFSAVAAFAYKSAFTPEPLSTAHTRSTFALTPAIAKKTEGGSCTSCHAIGVSMANREKMNANCVACHQTESFAASIIPAHRNAGITCITCHTEHRGQDFQPMKAALESCAKCHNDDNKNLYKGKSVHTAHRGTYGYPVLKGVWVWKGLDSEELAAKPEIATVLTQNKAGPGEPQQWRNAQFHAIHLQRVRVVAGTDAIENVDAVNQALSCSSCHKTGYMGRNVDRDFPRTTCARCHNAQTFEKTPESGGAETPSCTSCHVQHLKDTHWASSLSVEPEKPASGVVAP